MAATNPYRNSDAGYLGGNDVHTETWRTQGHRGVMVDTSPDGPLSPAVDDDNVNTCVKRKDAAGRDVCATGKLSGASDGAAASKRSAQRLAWHAENAGYDLEGPDGVNGRIT